MLIVFSGGSGAGKNTVIDNLLKRDEFAFLPTYTTREKREGESEGRPYYFITEKAFKDKVDNGELYEHQLVHNHYYGTSKILLNERLACGKILLKDIDVLGTQNLVREASADTKILTIFLKVESVEVLVKRLKARGEKEIDLRLKRYGMEQEYAKDYDYIVTNNVLGETIDCVLKIVNAEKICLHPLATCGADGFDENEIHAYAETLKNGQTLTPVKVALKGDKMYITEGHNRYLAALLAGRKVAKEIVTCEHIQETDQTAWESAINSYSDKK